MRKVSVICIGCESDYIDQTLTAQTYQNLEVVEAAIGGVFTKILRIIVKIRTVITFAF